MSKDFNPYDVQNYFGKTFITESGSSYGLTKEGKFTGRKNIEGTEIMLIAGVNPDIKSYYQVVNCLNPSISKKRLDNLIEDKGKEVEVGLRLVLSLTPKSAKQKGLHGLITSPIKEII